MYLLNINSMLNLILIFFEPIILVSFLIIYFKKRNIVLKTLIWSISLFLLSNIFAFMYFVSFKDQNFGPLLISLSYLLIGGGLILLIYYLEMYENQEPYTVRSTIATILILFTSLLQMLSNFLPEPIKYIGEITPLPLIAIGIIYLRYIQKIKNKMSILSQRKKIGKVSSGVFMIFVSPIIIYLFIGIIGLPTLLARPELKDNILAYDDPTYPNLGSIDPIISFSQLIGLIFLSFPILVSRSIFFMQSRKISRLIIITDSGIPAYDFNFYPTQTDNELLLSGALTAIRSVMHEATGTSQELKAIIFGDLHILIEVRKGFAVNLLVDNTTAFLKESLRLFTEEFEILFKSNYIPGVVNPELSMKTNILLQKNFGIELKELNEIINYQRQPVTFKSSLVVS